MKHKVPVTTINRQVLVTNCRLHKINYGVDFVSKERVSEVNALLLSSGVDGDGSGVHGHHDASDQLLLFQ